MRRRTSKSLLYSCFLVALSLLAPLAGAAHGQRERASTEVEAGAHATHALTGSVHMPDGSPVAGAVVTTSVGGQAVSADDGSFTLRVEIPRDTASVEVTAVANEPAGLGSLVASARTVLALGPTSSAGSLTLALSASCHPRWLPNFGAPPGTDGTVYALSVFDDGNGPALYAAGGFESAAGIRASHVAKWNGSRWSAVGWTVGDGVVRALAVFDDGSGPALYAAGSFTTAGGVPANNVAKWDGSAWSALGSGIDGEIAAVFALAVFDDGDGPALYAGGDFTSAGGTPAKRIARWNGSGWSALGTGVGGGGSFGSQRVLALAVHDDGSGSALYAGGVLASAGGQSVHEIARWDGASWSAVGSGIGNPSFGYSDVHALAVFDDGSGPALYAGGDFSTPGKDIARRDGSAWWDVGSGMVTTYSAVQALVVHDDGSGPALYVGGDFTSAGGTSASHLARLDASGWSAVGSGTSESVLALVSNDDGSGASLALGGAFESAGDGTTNHVARWDGSSLSGFGGDPRALDGHVHAFASFDDGTGSALYAGGGFVTAGGTLVNGIGRLDGSSWSSLAGGVDGTVYALATLDDGSGPALHAAGSFSSAGGVPALNVAHWDGASWTALGSGLGNPVRALAVLDDGGGPTLYAGGGNGLSGGVFRWNGASWSALGGGMNNTVLALAVFDDGGGPALYAGGAFTSAGGVPVGRLARWNGVSWSSVGGGVSGASPVVFVFATLDDGSGPSLYAGGQFNAAGGVPASRIARWNGASWSALGGGITGTVVLALAVHDDGSGPALYAGGLFGKRVAKWDGASWLAIGTGIDEEVLALASGQDGRGPALFVGGAFDSSPAGDSFFARWACRPVRFR